MDMIIWASAGQPVTQRTATIVEPVADVPRSRQSAYMRRPDVSWMSASQKATAWWAGSRSHGSEKGEKRCTSTLPAAG
jgi:hypothetical protein